MSAKSSQLRLGIFVFLGSAILVGTIFLIGNKESLFVKTLNIKAYFKSIEGLRKGAPVRLSGIDVGSVQDIMIMGDSAGTVEVKMRISSEIERYLRTDTRATIETEGLVGNKVVVLAIGTMGQRVGEGGVIKGVDPMGFGVIIDETKSTLEYTKEMTRNLADIIRKVNEGEGTVGKLLNDNTLYYNTNQLVKSADQSLTGITGRLDTMSTVVNALLVGTQSIVSNVNKVIGEVDNVIADVKAGKGLLGKFMLDGSPLDSGFTQVLDNIISITSATRGGASKFEENMEALKRNWLFKSYFEQRGYYDKTPYEKQLDTYMKEIRGRIEELDDRIERLKLLRDKAPAQENQQ